MKIEIHTIYRLMTRTDLKTMFHVSDKQLRDALSSMDVYHGTKTPGGHAVEFWLSPRDLDTLRSIL